jgi:hypothetical protein
MNTKRKFFRIIAIFTLIVLVTFITTTCSNETTSNTTPSQSVAKPTATPAGGIYNAAQTVTLATATSGADIYYTLNGTTPTTSSTKYTGSITINTSTTLKAIAVKTGMTNSEILNETYAINNLPIILPTTGVTTLTANTWANGSIATGGRQWFKFTATAATQYIHFEPGALDDVYVQLYDSNGLTVGSEANLYESTLYTSMTVTVGNEYYIKVMPYDSRYSGAYRIAFNASTTLQPQITLPTTGVTTLTANTWGDGTIAADGGQWFKFIATDVTQYIHFEPDTLSNVYIQLYDSTGVTVGDRTNLSSGYFGILYASRTVTSGDEYYIKVTPEYGSSGAYSIAFNTTFLPPNTIVTTLTENSWADGNIATSGEQWFTFTATVATQYIHFNPGTLNDVYVQLYDSTGATVGDRTNLSSGYFGVLYASRTVTSGDEYYIKVTPEYGSSGAYSIAFNTIFLPPNTIVTTLTANVWADGTLTTDGEQWFKFTATSATQYLHFDPGTLNDVYVQLYDSTGSTVGSRTNLYGSTLYTSRTVTISNEYYIKVTPYSGSGTYRIAFNTAFLLPNAIVTTLTANTWADGNIATGGEQWFTFTATDSTQYIHFEPGTLTWVNVQLYNNAGSTVGSRTNLYGSTLYTSRTVTIGNEYYIKVTPYNSSSSGAYRIAFNSSTTLQPPITLPTTGVNTLTPNTWINGNIATGGEQWFKFTATAANQYIHFEAGTLSGVYVQLYDNTGVTVGSQSSLYSNPSMSRTVTSGDEYYIKVTPYSSTGSGAYRIAFNATPVSPNTIVTTLTANIWANGNIATTGGEQWFKFTATASTQYIHFEPGTLDAVYVGVYDSTGSMVGIQTNLYSSTLYTSRTTTNGDEYYIKVTPYGSRSGGYQIAFNMSSTEPAIVAKNITQFRFADFSVNGTINNGTNNISVTVPNIVNLTTLVPTITHNGKSISPASGVAQDFTNPIQYTVTAEDNTTQNYTVTVNVTNTGLAAAFTWINTNASSGRTYTIVAKANESLASTTINAYSTTNIILSGGTTEKTISLSSNGSLFTVSAGTLTLENNITLAGLSSNNASLVRLNSSGALVMKAGSKIQNNTVTIDSSASSSNVAAGGGVYINGGSFTMDGGTITGNKVEATNSSSSSYNNTIKALGGGVYFYSGTFIMNNGTISNNTAYSNKFETAGGGVYVNNSRTFTMNGGTISDNTAESSSVLATSYTYGGGVAAWDSSTFTMTGGTISGNTVKTASNCYGGGVYSSSNFTKTGGTIYGSNASPSTLQNTAKNTSSGHAVYIKVGASTLLRNNTAGTTVNMDSSRTGSAGGWE